MNETCQEQHVLHAWVLMFLVYITEWVIEEFRLAQVFRPLTGGVRALAMEVVWSF